MDLLEDQREAYTVAEVADKIGCHKQTVYKLIRSGELPHFRPGGNSREGKILIRKEALKEWMKEREKDNI